MVVGIRIVTIYFHSHREFYPTRYELKPDLSLEEPGDFNPPFNFTFQVRSTPLLSVTKESRTPKTDVSKNQTCFFYASQIKNLGYFPVQDLQLYIAIPEVTKNGNQLLKIRDFHIDQVRSTQLDYSFTLPVIHQIFL